VINMTNETKPTAHTFVTIRMPVELVKQIDALAVEAMRSRSSQIMHLLKQHVEGVKG
jgi:metal-responsive CopG/Arc/MetJ family transcriptional regulator